MTQPDSDGDGVPDVLDSNPSDPMICGFDVDSDTCDDCASGTNDAANDGADFDADGLCDLGDPDDDGDGVADGSDSAPLRRQRLRTRRGCRHLRRLRERNQRRRQRRCRLRYGWAL